MKKIIINYLLLFITILLFSCKIQKPNYQYDKYLALDVIYFKTDNLYQVKLLNLSNSNKLNLYFINKYKKGDTIYYIGKSILYKVK